MEKANKILEQIVKIGVILSCLFFLIFISGLYIFTGNDLTDFSGIGLFVSILATLLIFLINQSIKSFSRVIHSENSRSRIYNVLGILLALFLIIIVLIAILIFLDIFNTPPSYKAKDAAIKSNIAQLRSLAEMLYDENNNSGYQNLCKNDSLNINYQIPTVSDSNGLKSINDDIIKKNDNKPLLCYSNKDKYCIISSLKSNKKYCIDSTGFGGDATNCDNINFQCEK